MTERYVRKNTDWAIEIVNFHPEYSVVEADAEWINKDPYVEAERRAVHREKIFRNRAGEMPKEGHEATFSKIMKVNLFR